MANNWIKYVLAFQKKNNITFGEALSTAGPSYRKQCGLPAKRKSSKKKKRSGKKKKRSGKKKKRSGKKK